MRNLEIEITQALPFLQEGLYNEMKERVRSLYSVLLSRKGRGSDFLGWLDLPAYVPENLLRNIQEDVERLRSQSRLLVIVGIGGSYLGTRAVIEAVSHPFSRPRCTAASTRPRPFPLP